MRMPAISFRSRIIEATLGDASPSNRLLVMSAQCSCSRLHATGVHAGLSTIAILDGESTRARRQVFRVNLTRTSYRAATSPSWHWPPSGLPAGTRGWLGLYFCWKRRSSYSSLSDAISLEVIGLACDEQGRVLNIADVALPPRENLEQTAPLVLVAGTCMNSGKTYAATELIKQATRVGMKVAAAKLSGVAALRDTLNMADHGAVATASFLDCGLPSTVGTSNLASIAKAVIARLNESAPDMIIIELGDGILGGYSVDSIFDDEELRAATAAIIFCASATPGTART